MEKKIAIIGAGIAGLSAGCYAQMNGFESEIFEMNSQPGGMCTAWNRKGYVFDGCIHWLVGSNPHSPLYSSWKAIGALDGKELLSFEYSMIVEGDGGKKLILYSDAGCLERHLIDLAPGDADAAKEFTNAIRDFGTEAGMSTRLARFVSMKRDEFVGMFKDPFLKEAFSSFGGPMEIIFQSGFYNRKDAAYPIGGSLEFAKGIEKRYVALGGRIHYKSTVQKIDADGDRVVGITLADGSTIPASHVISAADGFMTLFKLLGEEYLSGDIKAFYKNSRPVPSSLQVSLGIAADLSAEPYSVRIKLNRPLEIGDISHTHLNLRHYCYDKTLCPPGKSIVISLIRCDCDYWEKLYGNTETYLAEKQRIGKLVQEAAGNRYPQIRNKVEVVDVATPVTYARYTNAFKGGYMGWMYPAQNIPTEVPGLKGFSMAGQWTQTLSGLPTALITGKNSIMKICKEEGREFQENAEPVEQGMHP